MRNLTELLEEIPLDEMTGGLDMTVSADNNRNNNGQDGKVKIKSKAPIAAAIAACATLAVFGAVQFGNNVSPKPANNNDSSFTTTDAEDTSEELSPDEETQKNYELSRLYYDTNGFEYDYAADNISVMQGKVGTIVKGFKDYDIRVIDTKCSYPFYSIDIAVQRKDGGKLPNEDEMIINSWWKINGNGATGSCGYNDYDNVRIMTISFSEPELLYGSLTEDSDIDIELFTADMADGNYEENSEDLFKASIKVGELFGKDINSYGSLMMEAGVKGKQTFTNSEYKIQPVDGEPAGYEEAEEIDAEFTVNKISYSNCGIAAEIDFTKGELVDLVNSALANVIFMNEANKGDSFIKLKLKNDPDHLVSVFNGPDYNYWEYDKYVWCDRYSGSPYMLWINLTDMPCDMSQVESIYFGDAEIKLPETANSDLAETTAEKTEKTFSENDSEKNKSVMSTVSNPSTDNGKTNTSNTNTSETKTPETKKTETKAPENLSVKEQNEKLARLWYDSRGADYDLIKDRVNVLDNKYGTKKAISDDIDLWIPDVRVSYPFYEIDVAIKNVSGKEFDNDSLLKIYHDLYIDDEHCPPVAETVKTYGDTMVCTLYVDMTREAVMNSGAGSVIHVGITDAVIYCDDKIYNITSSKEYHDMDYDYQRDLEDYAFTADFVIGEDLVYTPNTDFDFSVDTNEKGKWNIQRVMHLDEPSTDIDYTINSVKWTNSKLAFNLKLNKALPDMDTFYFGQEIATAFHDQEYIESTGIKDRKFSGYDLYCDYDPDRDYHFVKLEMDDGNLVNLDFHDNASCVKESDGSYTITFNCIDYPFEADKVTAIHLGSAVINVK